MYLTTWIVTEVTEDDPQASVHFAVATTPIRARDVVARRLRKDPHTLSVVALWQGLTSLPPGLHNRVQLDRYLGPLEQYSPVLRDACTFCRGTGREVGSKPSKPCGICGGRGFKITHPG